MRSHIASLGHLAPLSKRHSVSWAIPILRASSRCVSCRVPPLGSGSVCVLRHPARSNAFGLGMRGRYRNQPDLTSGANMPQS